MRYIKHETCLSAWQSWAQFKKLSHLRHRLTEPNKMKIIRKIITGNIESFMKP